MRKILYILCIILVMLTGICACTPDNNTPADESYRYSVNKVFYQRPAFINNGYSRDALTVDIDDGYFHCFTQDTALADRFINAQRTLLHFLQVNGVTVNKLTYFVNSYGDSISSSKDLISYIDLSDTESYKQIMITLQTLWGDYTHYGYIYALSNAIAAELDWKRDTNYTEKYDTELFFRKNPSATLLLYPSFSTRFASLETTDYCKTLSVKLFKKINLNEVLSLPVDIQVDRYYSLIEDYAKESSIPLTRQECEFAYFGESIPLKIITSYAELFIDDNYSDYDSYVYDGYFSDYKRIYETADTINNEISAAVTRFNLEDIAGITPVNWLSRNTALAKFAVEQENHYDAYTKEVYVTSMQAYLHEYYHHIEHLLNPKLGQRWQSQAFCELGRSYSSLSAYALEKPFTQIEQWADLFYSCTGRHYQGGREDYFEAYDILCFITEEYELDYYYGRNAINSFIHYLIDNYGDDKVFGILLFPETVEDVTGKNWDTLENEWRIFIQNKFTNVDLPDWIK